MQVEEEGTVVFKQMNQTKTTVKEGQVRQLPVPVHDQVQRPAISQISNLNN